MAIVTFIGGTADMTRRVMDVNTGYIRMAHMPRQVSPYAAVPDMSPMETLRIDNYRLRQISEEHYIATWTDLV